MAHSDAVLRGVADEILGRDLVAGARAIEAVDHLLRAAEQPIEAGRLEARAVAEALADGEVRDGAHRLEQPHLIAHQLLDEVDAMEPGAGRLEIVAIHGGNQARDLVVGRLHPDLFDLVNALEEELVVVRSCFLRLLQAEELRHAEIALVLGEGHAW